jgi:hypothetical protein
MAAEFAALTKKIDRLSAQFDGRQLKVITGRVALGAKNDALKELRADAGADQRLHNWGKSGLKLNVGYDVTSDHEAVVLPRPGGPFSVLDGGRKAGTVAPKRKRGTRRMAINGSVRSFSKTSPLTVGRSRGKETWKRSTVTIAKKTPERVHAEVRRSLAEVFS